MELCSIYGIFETEELAELAAGRIRRTTKGIRRITLHPLGRSVPPARGRERFTMLPANLRMMNYATDVLWSETAPAPEPLRRRSTELLVICRRASAGRVLGIMQSLGATNVRKK